MGEMENANARLSVAVSNAATAMQMEVAARADWARLSLLKLAEEHPGVLGFSFSTEWEYDDEGGYFPVANIYAEYDPDSDQGDIDDDLIEVSHYLDPESVELLGETKTVAELKEVKY